MEFTEKLINLVKGHVILYDLSHSNYKNIRKKDKVWEEIAGEMKTNGPEVKKKWKNPRDTYAKYLRGTKTKTGQAKKNYTNWQWAPLMEHFKPYLAFAKTDSNILPLVDSNENQGERSEIDLTLDSIDFEEEFSENEINEDPQPAINSGHTSEMGQPLREQGNRNTRICHQKENKRSISSVDTVVQYLENKRRQVDMDAIDLTFLGHAKTVKSFSKKRQALTKMKIAEIIMQQELEHIDEVSLQRSSTSMTSDSSFQEFRPSSAVNELQHIDEVLLEQPSTSLTSTSSLQELRPPSGVTNISYPPKHPETNSQFSVSGETQRASVFSYLTSYDPCEIETRDIL